VLCGGGGRVIHHPALGICYGGPVLASPDPAVHLPVRVRGAVLELREQLVRRFGERFVAFVLFGSYARGEADADSDVDLLVVIDGLAGLERDEVYELGADVWMDRGVRLAPVAFSTDEWHEMRRRELLLPGEIDRDGVEV
jgi:uncharacterized protein